MSRRGFLAAIIAMAAVANPSLAVAMGRWTRQDKESDGADVIIGGFAEWPGNVRVADTVLGSGSFLVETIWCLPCGSGKTFAFANAHLLAARPRPLH